MMLPGPIPPVKTARMTPAALSHGGRIRQIARRVSECKCRANA